MLPHLTSAELCRCQYLQRLRTALDCSTFQAKQAIDDPGVYIAKRRIRTAAGSQAELLALAGTVFYHVVVYVKEGDKVCNCCRI